MDWAAVIFPSDVPLTGRANRVAQPVAPETGVANQTQVLNPPAPATAVRSSSGLQVTTQVTAQAHRNPNPYNNTDPAIGVAAHTPLETPIGVSPNFETPTEAWTYDYGNGGGI